MLEAIRTSQEGLADEVLRNIVSESWKRQSIRGFNEGRIQSLLEGIWNKLEYDFNYLLKASSQL